LSVKADLENKLVIKNELLEKFQFDLNSAKVIFTRVLFKIFIEIFCFEDF
jgi:hypothetical protein